MPSVVEQVCSKKHRLSVTVDCCDLYPPRQVLLRFIICSAKGTNEKTYLSFISKLPYYSTKKAAFIVSGGLES